MARMFIIEFMRNPVCARYFRAMVEENTSICPSTYRNSNTVASSVPIWTHERSRNLLG